MDSTYYKPKYPKFSCGVFRCTSNRASKSTLHKFPKPEKDRARFQKWVAACVNEYVLLKDPDHIYRNMKVCALHFSDKQHVFYRQDSRLRPTAVPDNNLPEMKGMYSYIYHMEDTPPNLYSWLLKVLYPALGESKGSAITNHLQSDFNGDKVKTNVTMPPSTDSLSVKSTRVVEMNGEKPNGLCPVLNGNNNTNTEFSLPTLKETSKLFDLEYFRQMLQEGCKKTPPLTENFEQPVSIQKQDHEILRCLLAKSLDSEKIPGCKKAPPVTENVEQSVSSQKQSQEILRSLLAKSIDSVKKRNCDKYNLDTGQDILGELSVIPGLSTKESTSQENIGSEEEVNHSLPQPLETTSYLNEVIVGPCEEPYEVPCEEPCEVLCEEPCVIDDSENQQSANQTEQILNIDPVLSRKLKRRLKTAKIKKQLRFVLGLRSAKAFTPKAKRIFREMLRMRLLLLKSRKSFSYLKRKSTEANLNKFHKMAQRIKRSKLDSLVLKYLIKTRRKSKKKIKRKLFTRDEKTMYLSVLKKYGSDMYGLISYILNLPSGRLLHQMSSNTRLIPGINSALYDHLKEVVEKLMSKHDRYCIIMLDEVTLTTELEFEENIDMVIGFQDLGNGRREKLFSDKALIFRIRDLGNKKYILPVSFFLFSSSGQQALTLSLLIKEVIRSVLSTGLVVVATIVDNSSKATNAAINSLINEERITAIAQEREYNGEYFTVEGQKVIPLVDFNSMLIAFRNNMISHNLEYTEQGIIKLAKWNHLVTAYKYDSQRIPKSCPKLTDNHIIIDKINKKDIRYCVQVFSSSLSAFISSALGHPRFGNDLGPDASDTADLLYFLDRLYDSISGSSRKVCKYKILRCAITEKSAHWTFWKDAIEILATMSFVHSQTGEKIRPLLFKQCIQTLKNLQALYINLKEIGFKRLLPKNLIKNPLINTSEILTNYNNSNINISHDCTTLINSYRNLLVKKMVHITCSEDGVKLFDCNIKNLIEKTVDHVPPVDSFDLMVIFDSNGVPYYQINEKELTDVMVVYIAGVVLRKILRKLRYCSHCIRRNTSKIIEPYHSLLLRRERKKKNARFYFPNKSFIKTYVSAKNVILNVLPDMCHRHPLSENLKLSIILNAELKKELNIACVHHLHIAKEAFLNTVIKMHVRDWCKTTNRFLKGKYTNADYNKCADPIWKAAADFFSMKKEGVR